MSNHFEWGRLELEGTVGKDLKGHRSSAVQCLPTRGKEPRGSGSALRLLFWGVSAAHLGLTLTGVFGDEHGNRVKLVIIALHLTRHEEIRVCGGGRGRRRVMEGGGMVNQAEGDKIRKKRRGKEKNQQE